MLNQKGQAFDAFKLLIAAVVAGAILVILLSMIGGFMPVGQDPLTVMGQELNKVKKGGVASTSTAVVQFQEGQEYTADAVAQEAGINKGMVVFCCEGVDDPDGKCEGYMFDEHEDAFECNGKTLTVKQNIAGKVRAYCPIGEGKCIIGFKLTRG
ncbi:MAG: hypothetical protein J7K68_03385 [Candidatus Diapherotrites archaeon]|nr:hypothetical protein [Candidatus Diapherotrites archaeon]